MNFVVLSFRVLSFLDLLPNVDFIAIEFQEIIPLCYFADI